MTFARYPSLIDKVVFITGGGSGIGAAMVEAFAAQEAKVAFVDIAVGAVQELVAKIGASGRRRLFVHSDLHRHRRARSGDGGGPAALGTDRRARQQRRERSAPGRRRIERRGLGPGDGAQLKHQFFAAQIARRSMRELGGGAIVNFSSTAFMSVFARSVGLFRRQGRRRRLDQQSGARVRTRQHPRQRHRAGHVITERQRRLWMSEADIADFRARQCLIHRNIVPEDMARAALFLSSDDSAMITKQCILVDAGLRSVGSSWMDLIAPNFRRMFPPHSGR